MNYAVGSSTSSWNDTPVTNTHESQWNYPQEQQQQQLQLGSSTAPTDFPLYDPFHSGAGLTIPSTTQTTLLPNGFSGNSIHEKNLFLFISFCNLKEPFADLCAIPQDNDINEMDALDKEIEDFKK